MTFYEAAIRVLEAEKRPLTTQEITERCISQGLLSHVGKNPAETLRSRLAVMSRRTRDRRVSVVAEDTFALVEWGLPEDAEALGRMGQGEEPVVSEEPAPLRAVERHPESRAEGVRAARQERHGRRHERERDRGGGHRRLPPLEEVALELLSEATEPIAPAALLERAVARDMALPHTSPETLLTALVAENQRRIDGGRPGQFALLVDGTLAVDRSGTAPAELQAAFAAALGLSVVEGRVVLSTPRLAETGPEAAVLSAARTAVKEARRSTARALRSQLASLDVGTFERACIKMLHGQSFRELKVVKRGKDGPLITGRRRDGSLELRYAIRVVKGGGGVDRRVVQDCRRDLSQHAAHVGLVLASGDARGEARSEALAQPALVLLWCGEGLADKFLEAHAGVRVTHAELFEIDSAFFQSAARVAAEVRERREERRRERAEQDEGEEGSGPEEVVATEGQQPTAGAAGGAPEAGAPGVEGDAGAERKRRRRRRRGRRGRGLRPGEAPGASGAPAAGEGSAAPAEAPAAAGEGPQTPAVSEPPPVPPPAASEGGAQ
ncbi:MAG: HTH domain-containing protein [Myxococcaceae bacterium]